MSQAGSDTAPLLLTRLVRRGRCPTCGEPVVLCRFESRAALLRCSGGCGWWAVSRPRATAALRRPALAAFAAPRVLPRLF